MTTRDPRLPSYIDLARASAVITRKLPSAAWTRLHGAVVDFDAVEMKLRFSFDEEQRVHLQGSAHTTVQLTCQLCSEPVKIEVSVGLNALLASTDQEATTWQTEDPAANIVVVSSPELNETELVEDELLLQLPSRICVDAECDRRPLMSYGPVSEQAEPSATRPFAALADLKFDN